MDLSKKSISGVFLNPFVARLIRCVFWCVTAIALVGLAGCQESNQGAVSRFEDLGAPSMSVVDAGMNASPSNMIAEPVDVGSSDAQEQSVQPCQRDRDCQGTDWCTSEGECEAPLAKWIGPTISDGLTRAAAASFDLVPGLRGLVGQSVRAMPRQSAWVF